MTLDSHSRQILALAWSRLLGLEDSALATAVDTPGGPRIEVPSDLPDFTGGAEGAPGVDPRRRRDTGDEQVASFLRLYGASVLYGPRWLLRAARDLDDEVLALESTLLRLGAAHGGRSLGESALYYAGDLPEPGPTDSVAVSEEPAHAERLERLCPADDVTEAGLSGLDAVFTLVPDDAATGAGAGPDGLGDPVAGAGWEEWQGLIAQIGVLVRPDVRRLGLGTYAAAVAVNEAYGEGLIPQWRARMGHRASQHLADRLGFEIAGSQTTVLFGQ